MRRQRRRKQVAALTAEKKKREKDEMAEFNEWKKMSWRRSRGKGRERDGPRDGSDGGDGGSSNSSEFDCPRALVDLDGWAPFDCTDKHGPWWWPRLGSHGLISGVITGGKDAEKPLKGKGRPLLRTASVLNPRADRVMAETRQAEEGMKFYAIVGGRTGNCVVRTWARCRELTSGWPGARCAKFKTMAEAMGFLNRPEGTLDHLGWTHQGATRHSQWQTRTSGRTPVHGNQCAADGYERVAECARSVAGSGVGGQCSG